MNHSLRTAIIGMGVISHYYVAAFEQVEECDLVAVCDLDPAKLDAHRAAGRRCTADYRELLAAPGIDAVVVNLPNSLHAQVCREALEAGKHLCCEKPLTLDLQEASALQSLAMQRRLTLLTAFHRRYNHHVIEAKLRDAFKDAVSITAHYDERIEDHAGADSWYLDPTRCGGGCIADNGPNIFDTLSFLLGRLELVDLEVRHDANGVDVGAEVDLRSARGQPVRAILSWDYPDGERKDVIVQHRDGRRERIDMLDGYAAFKSSLHHEYVGVLRHLAAAVRDGGEYGADGIDAVRLVAQCYARLAEEVEA